MPYLPIALLSFIAAFFGSVSGFGTSTIMIPILAQWYPLVDVLFFVGVIHLLSDIWKLYYFRSPISWKPVLLFIIPGSIMAYYSAGIPMGLDPIRFQRIMGIFLLFYTIFILISHMSAKERSLRADFFAVYKPDWGVKDKHLNALLGGVLSGITTGMFGIGGAVRGVFLSYFSLPRDAYIFTAGLTALFTDSARLIRYRMEGAGFEHWFLTLLILCVVASSAGTGLARRLVTKIPQEYFRYGVGAGLMILSFMMLLN